MFANTQMAGTDVAFPDVCLTPAPPSPTPVPVPYPNMGEGPTATNAVDEVLFCFMPAHNLKTVIEMTEGDNEGVATGVASGTVMGPARHVTGAFTVLIDGMPATRLTSMAMQNGTNAVGMRLVPSQTTVLLLAP
jgi:hypothetical protein